MENERYYAEVVKELKVSDPKIGLWAEAFSDAQGDPQRTKALYLRYRVAQLVKEEQEHDKFERNRVAENAISDPVVPIRTEDLDRLYSEVRVNLRKYVLYLLGFLMIAEALVIVWVR